MHKQLALAMKDEAYLMRLSNYFRRHPIHHNWTLIVFTSVEAYKAYVMEGGKIDYIVAEPALLQQLQEELHTLPSAALIDKESNRDSHYPVIQKFQPLSQLLQAVIEIYYELTRVSHASEQMDKSMKRAKVISTYSLIENIGKTAVALHLANAAGQHHHRVLYLNFERWNSFETWLGEASVGGKKTAGMSELLYHLRKDPQSSKEQVVVWQEYRQRNNKFQADYILPFELDEDRLALTKEDALGIIELAIDSGNYDFIIVDMNSGMGELELEILERSDQVVLVANGDQAAICKQTLALSFIEKHYSQLYEKLVGKLEIVFNRTSQRVPEPLNHLGWMESALAASDCVMFPEVDSWREQGQARLLDSPSFRATADKLFNRMISLRRGL